MARGRAQLVRVCSAFRHAYRQTPGYNLSVSDMSACPFWEWAAGCVSLWVQGCFPVCGGGGQFREEGPFRFCIMLLK